ncbi:MAG: hypothetical protein ACP5KD_01825 [Fervidobacterium sp.]|jgi:hypothetical protein
MTLVRSKQRSVVLEKESQVSLGLLKYMLPFILLLLIVFGTYILNQRIIAMNTELEQYRKNLIIIQQQEQVVDLEISKVILGCDVIN